MKRTVKEGGLRRSSPVEFEAFWSSYTSWVRFKDLGIDADRCRELIDQQGDWTFHGVFRAVLTAYGEHVGKERVGEKCPGHVFFLSHLLAWFPEAQVVVLQRDPRAVVASQLRTPWVQDRRTPLSLRRGILLGKRFHEVAYYADDWAKIYEEIVPAWQSDSRVLLVRYEALVKDVEGELRALCDFLGEPYEPAMLTDRTHATVPSPAGTVKARPLEQWRRKHQAKTLRPVSADSLGKWRDGLARTEVALIEGRCMRGMRAAGYTPSVPAFQRSVGRVASEAISKTGSAEEGMRSTAEKLLYAIRSAVRKARRHWPGKQSSP